MCLTGHVGMFFFCAAIAVTALMFLATNPHVGAKDIFTLTLVVLVCTGLVVIVVSSLLDRSAGNNESFIMESASSALYWKQRAEKDTSQPTNNPHLLAARIIKSGKPVTHNEVNTVLEHQNISVTQEELDVLTNIPFKECELTAEGLKNIKEAYPRKPKGVHA